MNKLLFFSLIFCFNISLFSEPATKADIRLIIEQTREEHRVLREDMNKRFEQVDKRFEQVDRQIEFLRADMNSRFEILFGAIGLLFVLNCGFLAYLWKGQRRLESNRYDIKNFAYQLYRAEPEIKAEIYFHLQKEAEKAKQKTVV